MKGRKQFIMVLIVLVAGSLLLLESLARPVHLLIVG